MGYCNPSGTSPDGPSLTSLGVLRRKGTPETQQDEGLGMTERTRRAMELSRMLAEGAPIEGSRMPRVGFQPSPAPAPTRSLYSRMGQYRQRALAAAAERRKKGAAQMAERQRAARTGKATTLAVRDAPEPMAPTVRPSRDRSGIRTPPGLPGGPGPAMRPPASGPDDTATERVAAPQADGPDMAKILPAVAGLAALMFMGG